MYHWQDLDWPAFRYSVDPLRSALDACYARSQQQVGHLRALPKATVSSPTVDVLVREAMDSAAIEGEIYRADDVRSSVLVALGLAAPDSLRGDARALAVGRLTATVQKEFGEPLSLKQLHHWHELLFAAGAPHAVGAWRASGFQGYSDAGLAGLVELGVLAGVGEGRGRRYVLGAVLE